MRYPLQIVQINFVVTTPISWNCSTFWDFILRLGSFVYRHEKSPHEMYFDCPGCVPSAQELELILKGKHLIYLGDSLSEEFVNILLCHHQRLNITLEYEYYDEDLSKVTKSSSGAFTIMYNCSKITPWKNKLKIEMKHVQI